MRELFLELLRGKKLVPKRGMGFIRLSDFGEVIHYSHYGSSAVKVTFKDFEWIVKNIFEKDHTDFKVEV